MDVKYIAEKIKIIESIGSDDPEESHILEDELHEEVLQAIANGAENPSELAKEALKTSGIDFPRWHA